MRVDALYVGGSSALHRLHPLTKVTLAGATLVVALAREDAPGHLALGGPWAALLLVLALAAGAGVIRRLLGALLRIVLPVVISLYLLQAVVAMARGEVGLRGDLLRLGARLLERVDSLGMRLTLFVAVVLLVLLTTHPARLIQALAARGAPPWLCYVVAAALQMLPATLAQARAITDAQRTRGLRFGTGSPLARARAVLPLMAPLLLGILSGAEEQAMALEARGFSRVGPRSTLVEVEEAAWEPGARWVAVLLAAAAFLALRGWFGGG